jgi:hypothetical protein
MRITLQISNALFQRAVLSSITSTINRDPKHAKSTM